MGRVQELACARIQFNTIGILSDACLFSIADSAGRLKVLLKIEEPALLVPHFEYHKLPRKRTTTAGPNPYWTVLITFLQS